MAKLSKLKNRKPLYIGIDGIFIQNMPAKQMQDLFGNMETRLGEEPEVVVVDLFSKLICDEEGNAFEDVSTYDEIISALSMKDIQEIMTAITTTVSPSGSDVEK